MVKESSRLISIIVTLNLILSSILNVNGFPKFITNHKKKIASEFRREMCVEVVLDSQTLIQKID